MKIFKGGVTSMVLVALILGSLSSSVSAYDAWELTAANELAAKGVINTQMDAAAYNLDATITRGEMAKVAVKIAGIESNSNCENNFSDITDTTPNSWVCGYVEALLSNGLISANDNFNPNDDISKSEVVKLMLTAAGINVKYTDTTWQEDFVIYAIEAGYVARFSDYNTSADRGFVFATAYTATIEESEGEDLFYELESLLGSDSESIGFTTGGGFGADYIRTLVANQQLPNDEDVKYNNFLKDYSFDKIEGECTEKFCPIFNGARIINPTTGIEENWLEMYLGSNIKEEDYVRKPTNFVIVMDISGSMNSTMSSSYTEDDLFNTEIECEDTYTYFKPLNNCVLELNSEKYVDQFKEYEIQTKLELSKEITQNLIGKLQTNDRIGIVTFNEKAVINHELIQLNKLDTDILIDHIEDISTSGSTNMQDGFEKGINIFSEDMLSDSSYQNRVIFITDAMPNTGGVSEVGFKTLLSEASDKSIYFSFIGVGLDFKQNLIDTISQTKGGNYFFVNSGYDFYREVIQDFDYSFFPMFFNISLKETSDEKIISNVYGLDSDILKGDLIKINTLFPSRPQLGGSTKGSVILFKLADLLDKSMTISMEYEDSTGVITSKDFDVTNDTFEIVSEIGDNHDEKSNIYKAVLIIEYVKELKSSLINENAGKLEEIILLFNENKSLFGTVDEVQLEEEIDFIKQVITLLGNTGDYWTD